MKINTNSILILFGIGAFALMACFPMTMLAIPLFRPNQSSPDHVATVQAVITQKAYAATQSAPTLTPVPATATSVPTTPIPPTKTAVPTSVTYCDWAMFIKDVTIPDGTQLSPGETFTNTWRLQNRGTCTWTPDYDVVFYNGAQMSGTIMQVPGY
ncbi:MAG: NBR1-Ig-like domain-containing protein, partial [Anaerolineales bacterium]